MKSKPKIINNELSKVLVFGGSQGAKSINEALIDIIKNNKNTNYNIIWSCGQKQYDEIIKKIDIKNIKNAEVLPYIYNMQEVMKEADIIISRSGAMTITEISNLGKPAIFVPFPFATENHQEHNAKVLEKVGAAKIILDKDLNSNVLTKSLEELLSNKEELAKMGKNAKKVSILDANERIYNQISKLIKNK